MLPKTSATEVLQTRTTPNMLCVKEGKRKNLDTCYVWLNLYIHWRMAGGFPFLICCRNPMLPKTSATEVLQTRTTPNMLCVKEGKRKNLDTCYVWLNLYIHWRMAGGFPFLICCRNPMLPKTSATEVLQTRTTPNVMRKRRENKKLGHDICCWFIFQTKCNYSLNKQRDFFFAQQFFIFLT